VSRLRASIVEIIEKIEGEAKLHFSFNDDSIDFVDIEFFSSRGIERILEGRNPLDALVINPRVCGICNHAHLIATVEALEDCYEAIDISPKAKIIRELTLNFELIQNHFKWFFLTIYPLLGKNQAVQKALLPSQTMAKAIATLAGQYPHNSYAIVGGITSKVLSSDLIKVENSIDEVIAFYQKHLVHFDVEYFLSCNNIRELLAKEGDLPETMQEIYRNGWEKIGKSYDRFLVAGENSYFKRGRSLKTRRQKSLKLEYIQEQNNSHSLAKNVTYRGKYYEVGPLSRAMVKKTPLIKDAHRNFQDSLFSRVLARVCEIPQLLFHSKKLLAQIDLSQPSYIKPHQPIEELCSSGVGVVEAARGSLIHSVDIKDGAISKYNIITPTQWNLSNGTRTHPAIAQKAMFGLKDTQLAQLVFKSFDVCSVCTTH
jgi:hydrogenase large subunit